MRLSLTVVNGATGARRDVLVDADPETELEELLPRLLDATNGQMHPGFARQVGVWIDGQPVEGDRTLRGAAGLADVARAARATRSGSGPPRYG